MSVAIRRFAAGDEAGIAAVIVPIQREEFGVAITLAEQPDLRDIAGFYQTGAGDFWIVEDAGQIVGTIALKDIGNSQAALRKMFVAAAYRGRAHGVADGLLAHLLSEAGLRGVQDIFLGTTAQFLAAHRFYEKNGFTEIAKDTLPSGFPLMAVDTRFYTLQLV